MVWERAFVTIIYKSVSQKKHWQVGTLRRNNFADVCITWKCCTQRIKSAVLRLNVQGKIYVQCGRYTNELSFKVSAHKSQYLILYLVENLLLNVNNKEILFWLNHSLPPLYALRGIFLFPEWIIKWRCDSGTTIYIITPDIQWRNRINIMLHVFYAQNNGGSFCCEIIGKSCLLVFVF